MNLHGFGRVTSFRALAIRVLAGMALVLALGISVMLARPGQRGHAAVAPSALTPAGKQTLPARDLRGYGRLSAEFTLYRGANDAQASHLRIACASAEKAKIVHAKYLSDLHLLGGVQDELLTVAHRTLPVVTVPQQGVITAFRDGKQVIILAAEHSADLAALVGQTKTLARKGAEFTPSGVVPMFLDSWDKYGFRYYYRPWEVPTPEWGAPEKVAWKDYDVRKEFDYAKQFGNMGIIYWSTPELTDTAEGMTNDPFWNWAAKAAERRNLPVVVNTMSAAGTWLLNRYRDDLRTMAPQYSGGYYAAGEGFSSGKGDVAWTSTVSKDVQLSLLQNVVRDYAQRDTTIEYLEPHGELRHGAHDILTEYGPVADRSFRSYLQAQYGSPTVVSRRWYGDTKTLRAWDDIRVPELANFLGFDGKALDLAGAWRIKYEEFADGKALPSTPAPAEWYQPTLDDSAWPTLQAPGSDVVFFLPRRPAVLRRHFTVDTEWKLTRDRVWLYIFDLNRGNRETVTATLNGEMVGQSPVSNTVHWAAFEVTQALRDGENVLAVRVPQGYLGYRVYLSGHEPVQYPKLGAQKNAQWVDFIRWQGWTRLEMCRRGYEMIRQADPDRSIICMAPDGYFNGIKVLCEDYGGHYHNTGYMSGFWAEFLPMMMRGADLPFSLEPGNHPHTLPELKGFLGLWLTEGNNAIHYFIHLGAVLWHPEIKKHFEEMLPVIKTIGKVHVPKGQVAFLYSDEVNNLSGYPWGSDPKVNLPSGYMPTQMNTRLRNDYHMDGLTTLDFARGNANPYKVIVDSNTSILEPKQVREIEQWVRNGGTFITFNQTGRHTPEVPDSWPISALSGYQVTGMSQENRALSIVPGQTVLDAATWTPDELRGRGLSLRQVDPACQDVLRWEDGTTAVGVRPLGKGYVVQVGWQYAQNPKIYRQLIAWRKIPLVPARADGVTLCHSVSNNGLYDVWALWNGDRARNAATDLVFREGLKPVACIDVKTGKPVTLTNDAAGCRLDGLTFEPLEAKMFMTPRRAIATASLDWVTLQWNWWRGTKPPQKQLKPYKAKYAVPLTNDWAVKPLADDDTADHTALAAPALNDRAWQRLPFTVWSVGEDLPTHHAFFRRRFTVPGNWKHGEVELWMVGWQQDHKSLREGRMRVWLDGKEIQPFQGEDGILGMQLTAQLQPGSTHWIAAEVRGEAAVVGLGGNSWLAFLPHPQAVQDLSGAWAPSMDGLTFTQPVTLPGPFEGAMIKRKFFVDAAHAGQNVMIHIESDARSSIVGGIINGHWVMRLHHEVGSRTLLNITPWVKFGQENEYIIVRRDGPGNTAVRHVSLDFFKPSVYP